MSNQSDAEIVAFPRDGFILGEHMCRLPSADKQELCFGARGHEGAHIFRAWQGCRARVPFGRGTVPFQGFAS
jgi:hypothetical protein